MPTWRRPITRTLVTVLMSGSLLVLGSPARADAGDLDPLFSEDGVQVTSFPGHYGVAHGAVVHVAGRMVVVGGMHTNEGIGSDFALVRYTFGGELDATFGVGGRILTDFDGRYDQGEAVAVQPDGRLVAVGSTTDDIAVARYGIDGSLDASFDGDGRKLIDLGGSESARDVAIQSNGKILVAVTDGMDFGIVRLMPDGGMDGSFGNGGVVRTDWAGFQDSALAIAVQPDGRIVAGGFTIAPSTREDFALARYLPNGALDPTFGNGGRVRTDFLRWGDRITDLVFQPDGKIVVSGQASADPGWADQRSNVALARYLRNGALDATFGTRGRVHTNFGSFFDNAHGMALQPDGRIVVGSSRYTGQGWSDAAVARYEPNGDLDPTFGTGGIAIAADTKVTSDDVGGLVLVGNRIALATGTSTAPAEFGFLAVRFLSS
jgi:uncharacterized delta-60 repeat protein